MRVKIGDEWYRCDPGTPIMIEMDERDKDFIQRMEPHKMRYALFHPLQGWTPEQQLAWMDEGATHAVVKGKA